LDALFSDKVTTFMKNAQHRANLTTKYPELGTGPVSKAPYCDRDFFEKEVGVIFKKMWLWAIRESEIPGPGHYMVKDLPTLQRSVIIVRGHDNKIRAFENVCLHRGARLVVGEQGCVHRFTCPFHAWTYNTEGALVGVPDADGYFDLEQKKHGLRVVPCEGWEGFVFIHPEDTPSESLEGYLGDCGVAMHGYPFANGCDRYQYQAVLHVNWKVAIDVFPETLHVPFLHKDSVKPTLAGPRNPFGHLVDFVAYGRHRTASVWGEKDYAAPRHMPTPLGPYVST
jgi:phenylpropionate dioxygenase-like ring-hydroxylating dioxygenase large terminal subunit